MADLGSSIPASEPSILVVEDDDDLRRTIREVLEDEGYTAIAASDGEAALTLLRAGLRPTMILLDLWMPRLDGWQFWHIMMGDPALEDIPVVVLTAASSQPVDTLGVREVLRKPVQLSTLVELADRYCRYLPSDG